MFNNVKTRHNIEAVPWCSFDNILMNGCNLTRGIRQLRIRFHTVNIERFARNLKKITASTSDFEKLSRRLHLTDQIDAPPRVEKCEPVLFIEPQVPQILVRSPNLGGSLFARFASECERRPARADVTKPAVHALHKRTIETTRI